MKKKEGINNNMRSKYKSWQDKNNGGWTRRIVWLQEENVSIHLKMEDSSYGIFHLFLDWKRKESAQEIYNLFRNGKTILEIKQLITN